MSAPSASAGSNAPLTRVLHVPPMSSAFSAPSFPIGFSRTHSPNPQPKPLQPSSGPPSGSRALQGGLSRSLSASGSSAARPPSAASNQAAGPASAIGNTTVGPLSMPGKGAAGQTPASQPKGLDSHEALPHRASALPPLSPSSLPSPQLAASHTSSHQLAVSHTSSHQLAASYASDPPVATELPAAVQTQPSSTEQASATIQSAPMTGQEDPESTDMAASSSAQVNLSPNSHGLHGCWLLHLGVPYATSPFNDATYKRIL